MRNLQKWYDYLVSKGVECVSKPERSPRGHSFFFVKDFDGNLIELMDLGNMYLRAGVARPARRVDLPAGHVQGSAQRTSGLCRTARGASRKAMSDASADCLTGNQALQRGAWVEARAAFEAALEIRESPEALEGLGVAAWWLDLADLLFDVRERAYRLYLSRDDKRGAARLATSIAWDCWAFRGEHAVANGWLHRARRHLDNDPDCAERAWLELREGVLALFEDGDPDRAHAHAVAGIRAAKAAGSTDLEMLGRAVQGLTLVSSGAVAEGMGLLDEVNTAVVAGEFTDLIAVGLSCCYMIAACDRVRDYDRALQWCHAAQGVLREVGAPSALCGVPDPIRVDLHVARDLDRGGAGTDGGDRRTGSEPARDDG